MAPKNEHSISVKVNLDVDKNGLSRATAMGNSLAGGSLINGQEGVGVNYKTAKTIYGKDAAGNRVAVGTREEQGRIATNDEILNRIAAVQARRIRMNIPVSPGHTAALDNINAHLGAGDLYNATRGIGMLESSYDDSISRFQPDLARSKRRRGIATREGTIYKYEQLLARNPNASSAAGLSSAIQRLAKARNNADTDPGEWAQAQLAANKAATPFRDELPVGDKRLAMAGIGNRKGIMSAQELAAFNANVADPSKYKFGRNDPELAASLKKAAAIQATIDPLVGSSNKADQDKLDVQRKLLNEELGNATRRRKVIEAEESNAKKGSKVTDWLDDRGARLSGAMAFRSGIGRLTHFGQASASAEGDALTPTNNIGFAKTATGVGTDVMMNKFISKGGIGNALGMATFGIADAVVGTMQALVQRGIGVRRQASASATTYDSIISRSLSGSTTFDKINESVAEKWTTADEARVLRLSEFDARKAHRESTPWYTDFFTQRAQAIYDTIARPSGSSDSLGLTQMKAQQDYLNARKREGITANNNMWHGLVSTDDMFKAMGEIGGAGMQTQMLLKGRKGYREITSDMSLGSIVAGASKSSGMSIGALAGMVNMNALGIGRSDASGKYGLGGDALHMAALVQQGLPAKIADQIATSNYSSGMAGGNVDVTRQTNYINSLMSSGFSPGRIGTMMAAGDSARMSKTGMAGFGGMRDQATFMAAIIKSGGDIGKMFDARRGMSDEEQVAALTQFFGPQGAQWGLQNEGMSESNALTAMAAGPNGSLRKTVGIGSEVAHQDNLLGAFNFLENMSAAYTPGEKSRNAVLKAGLDAVAVSITRLASNIGGIPDEAQ